MTRNAFRPAGAAFLAVAAMLTALAWASPGAAQATDTAQVAIRLFRFQPSPIRVKVGSSVAWENRDAIEHSVTAGTPEKPAGAFDSGLFDQGGRFEHRFGEPGSFAYFCRRHPSMRGVVEVTR